MIGPKPKEYILFFIHKLSTLSDLDWVRHLWREIQNTSTPVVCALHPNSKDRLSRFAPDLLASGFHYIDALPYADFGALLANAACVVTDSAGTQEEATVADIPCIIVGAPTARSVVLSQGTGIYIGYDVTRYAQALNDCLSGQQVSKKPELWDDKVSKRIAHAMSKIIDREARPVRIPWKSHWDKSHDD
jgi:UDP-N-acetylglucosamine 2-epimerase (non-hydrolysing)